MKQPAPEPKKGVPATMEVPAFTQAARRDLCSPDVAQWWDNHGQKYSEDSIKKSGGAIACSSDPTRPVILLFHGVHQNKTTWTAPSYVDFAYDYNNKPPQEQIGDRHDAPPPGPIHAVGRSNWLYGSESNREKWDRDVNWFDYLRMQNFTVATWSQDTMLIADALPGAHAAFKSFLDYTAQRNPGAPPPVVILAHSRGGLVARQLLKEKPDGLERIKWIITIHSPHKGSQLGKYPNELGVEVVQFLENELPGDIPSKIKEDAKKLAADALEPLTRWIQGGEERELYPGSKFLDSLASGETAVPGAKYYTFGGTNPRVFRFYVKTYDAESIVPRQDGTKVYYVWRVNATELPVSPILDAVRDFVPEVKPGYGDSLVAEESTKLPWSTQHFKTSLNHAEVLWDRALQKQVVELIK